MEGIEMKLGLKKTHYMENVFKYMNNDTTIKNLDLLRKSNNSASFRPTVHQQYELNSPMHNSSDSTANPHRNLKSENKIKDENKRSKLN